MSIRWTNNAASVLASDITAGTLSITVTTGHGDRFPEIVAPHYCMVTLMDSSGNREIVKVTARDSGSNTMTITRAQEGTSARSFAAGSLVELRITKNAMDEVSKAADINENHYVCDASAADQGAAVNSASLKSIVDSLGATEEATIELPHTGTGDTTTYTVGTNLTIPATVTLRVHKGARVSPSAGVTLTVNGIVQAGAYTIFAGAGTVTVSTYPQDQAWWGSTQRLDVTGLSIGTKTLAVADNTTVSAFAATLLDDNDAAAARATLGALAASDLTAASESAAGIAELATHAEVNAGTDDARIVTPKKLASYVEHRGSGMKNIIINGGMRVAQRAASQTLDHTPRYGPCDRWVAYWNSASGVTPGTQFQSYSADVEMWNTLSLGGLTCTQTNTLYAGQRIEAKNSQCLIRANDHGGVSIQFKLWHNFGSAVDVYIAVATANSVDVFSAVTSRYVSSAISCPSDNWSTIKAEGIDIGTTNIDKGVFVYVSIDTPVCSGKNVYLADAQLEIGPKCTTIEKRSYEYELALCQRYYEKSFPQLTAPAQNAGQIGAYYTTQIVPAGYQQVFPVFYKVTKRAAPTITLYNPSAANGEIRNGTHSTDWGSSTALNVSGDSCFIVSGVSPGGSGVGNLTCFHWKADAEL